MSKPILDTSSQVDEKYIDRVIDSAIQQANDTDEPEQVSINMTESQEKMAREIRIALGLAFGVTINSAIKYALYYTKNQQVDLEQLPEYLSCISSYSVKIKVTPETWSKLRELNKENRISECAAVGIELLYKKLINFV
ncbi:hypothetical protein DSM106972_056740 [Dulcicalothrix desertica PCC 7102]|uniref:Uncharacterized protein n=1 Tax=Dulcicalothrix desertica PCC 7102 TaxID=232991 RepID=A0A433V9I7_9CYAN|nr:hypothetical protein [Dulcicalothrix desertica]RUT02754.1 hypothetical protein DSM106972_056740 [Dulcicalothrix desertica PCC 7102]TWH39011.1 hypothetical protein CAL7102_08214 [Dulcicalothrix desertica PCC 7102]